MCVLGGSLMWWWKCNGWNHHLNLHSRVYFSSQFCSMLPLLFCGICGGCQLRNSPSCCPCSAFSVPHCDGLRVVPHGVIDSDQTAECEDLSKDLCPFSPIRFENKSIFSVKKKQCLKSHVELSSVCKKLHAVCKSWIWVIVYDIKTTLNAKK